MATQTSRPMTSPAEWYELAQQLRVDSIRATTRAGSGHPTSSLSAADLLAVLMSAYLSYDWHQPHYPNNDHLIFSKGHAAPLLYAAYKAAGAISDQELLTLRHFGSRLQGHPVPVLPYVEVATGSVGQGLPIGVGIALAGQYLDKRPYRVWVLLGDSEMELPIPEPADAPRLHDEFLAAVAHDLKTPLTALKGRTQLLQRQIGIAYAAPIYTSC